jgi:hypothetical protein
MEHFNEKGNGYAISFGGKIGNYRSCRPTTEVKLQTLMYVQA